MTAEMEIDARNPKFIAAIKHSIEHSDELERRKREEAIQTSIRLALSELESRIREGKWENINGTLRTILKLGSTLFFDQERLEAIRAALHDRGFSTESRPQYQLGRADVHLVVSIPPVSIPPTGTGN